MKKKTLSINGVTFAPHEVVSIVLKRNGRRITIEAPRKRRPRPMGFTLPQQESN